MEKALTLPYFYKFFFTKPSICIHARKGFKAKKIKNFSILLMIIRIFLDNWIVIFCFTKTSVMTFVEFFSFFDFEYCTSVLIAGICLNS